jgi:hypothetical protein
MIDNDEGFPTGAEDATWYAISPCLSCPECGNMELDKRPNDCLPYTEVTCWNCGAHWYERDFEDDGEDDD